MSGGGGSVTDPNIGILSALYQTTIDPIHEDASLASQHSVSPLISHISPSPRWTTLSTSIPVSNMFDDTDTNTSTGNLSGIFGSSDTNWTTQGPADVTEDAAIVMEGMPYAASVILILLYTLTTIAAVCGNSLAILVFTRGKRSNTDLRPFLINLAAADLIMAIFCIPFTFAYQMTGHWMFSEVMCPIVQCCQVISVAASVSTNTAIGIDRLVAVKFPFRKRVTSSYTRLVILGIWVFASGLGSVPLMKGRTQEVAGKIECEEHWSSQQDAVVYGFFIMILTYFLPLTILSATYTIIGRHLWRHKVPGNADDQRDALQLKAKRKVRCLFL
ncbi:neuromedin-K receptor [Elysia marginata]|uniref:Neuromedin-K receptor n=1 Tax=Elysia marginata TaxID=1093978 RepID=A0AAV4H859_9GAST|nr:neuromedin-K receptor [Elysia marginata]